MAAYFAFRKKPKFIWEVWSPFVIGAGLSALGPIIPLIRGSLNINSSKIGGLLSYSSIMALLVSIIIGKFSDSWGKKSIIIFASMLAGLGASLIGVSQSVFAFCLGYVLFFPGLSLMAVMMKSLVSDLATESRALSLTKSAIAWNLGASLCCLATFLLLSIFNWRAIFWILVVLLTFTIFLFYTAEDIVSTHSKKGLSISLDSKPKIILVFMIIVLVFFLEGSITFNTWLTTYLSSSDLSVMKATLVSAVFWMLFILGAWIKRMLLLHVDELLIVLLSTFLMLLFFILFMSESLFLKIISALFVALNFASSPVLLTAMAVDHWPNSSVTITGLLQGTIILANIIFQPFTGLVIDKLGSQNGVFIPIFCCIIALVVCLSLIIETPKRVRITKSIY